MSVAGGLVPSVPEEDEPVTEVYEAEVDEVDLDEAEVDEADLDDAESLGLAVAAEADAAGGERPHVVDADLEPEGGGFGGKIGVGRGTAGNGESE